MASGFFALLDDISALMDDVASASKIATSKTAGILGDDLAVNAEKATGFLSSRELPVLWKITKGALLNKVIIIPFVFLLSFLYKPAITLILIIGGLYLAYEGVEKIIEYFFHKQDESHKHVEEISKDNSEEEEKVKVKSAITTDFILSLEIVIIALGSVLDKPMSVQIATVSIVALLATVGVYGIVALIVRMDDTGFKLIKHSNNQGFEAAVGRALVKALPLVIRTLAVVGTIALILVSGGIFTHNIESLHHFMPQIPGIVKEIMYGLIAGLLAVGLMTIGKLIFKKK